MAIVQAICTSFKDELVKGTHNFSSNTFKLALYAEEANLGSSTTVYTAASNPASPDTYEVSNSGTGYSEGGVALTGASITSDGTTVIIDFDNAEWAVSSAQTLTARGALLYNDTDSSDKSVAVLNFGIDRTVSDGTFTVKFPTPDKLDGFIRIVSSG